jgi:thiol-disulfide isomerase/thioredoxin
MSDTTIPKPKPRVLPVDDYDDVEGMSYDAPAVPIQAIPAGARGRAKTRYEDDDEGYEGHQGYGRGSDQDYDDEVSTVSVSRSRALILGLSVFLLIGIFGTAIWLLANKAPDGPATTPIAGVPVITGLTPNTNNEDQRPNKDAFAPDFSWQENGKTVSLSSYRGSKPVFVNFWGTWCPPCRGEMPEMETSYTKHYGQIEVVGVSMGPRDTASMVLDFVNQFKYNWKFIHDGDYKVAERYQIAAVPSSYFIGTDGKIKAVQVGAMTGPMLESYIQQVVTR